MPLSDAQFKDIHSRLATDGGFTVDAHKGEAITTGISVAPHSNERRLAVTESTPDALKQYHADNAPRFAKGASLGGWRSENDDFLDTPTVYPNTPGGNTRARRQMVHSRQEAGFNLDNFQEVFNPFHPEARRKTGMEPHELADIAVKSKAHADFVASQPEVQSWINAPAERGRLARGQAAR